MNRVRTRYAPSPTGRMHVGNLRTALDVYKRQALRRAERSGRVEFPYSQFADKML